MLGKNDILRLILDECDICLHLFEKVPDDAMDYRPTPGQRSTLELLQYVSFCVIGGARTMAEGTWDGYKEVEARAADMTAQEFPAAMARQKQELLDLFATWSQDDVTSRKATTPLGAEVSLEEALVQVPLKWIIAYRMQLFLYAKQAGNEDIWTPNCWGGVDTERPRPSPASESAS